MQRIHKEELSVPINTGSLILDVTYSPTSPDVLPESDTVSMEWMQIEEGAPLLEEIHGKYMGAAPV